MQTTITLSEAEIRQAIEEYVKQINFINRQYVVVKEINLYSSLDGEVCYTADVRIDNKTLIEMI